MDESANRSLKQLGSRRFGGHAEITCANSSHRLTGGPSPMDTFAKTGQITNVVTYFSSVRAIFGVFGQIWNPYGLTNCCQTAYHCSHWRIWKVEAERMVLTHKSCCNAPNASVSLQRNHSSVSVSVGTSREVCMKPT